jgi:YVTN family beta-propeller protein
MSSKSSHIVRCLVHSIVAATSAAATSAAFADPSTQFPTYTVGQQPNGSFVMSTGQIVTPAGKVTILGSPVRAKAVALSPTNPNSAAILLMGASSAVDVVDLGTGAVLQNYTPFNDKSGAITGITYSPDGKHLLFSQDDSYLAVANVDPKTGLLSDSQHLKVAPSQAFINCAGITLGLPSAPVTTLCGNFYNGNNYTSNPAGVAVSSDSKTAYVVLNQNNTLQAVDLTVNPVVAKGTQVRVGNAPNSVVLHGKYAYVSNEGGRVAQSSDFTNSSSGTPIVASRESGTAITGTISVVDTTNGQVVATIDTGGRHPTGMTIAGDRLFVTNTGSDNIGVIDLDTNRLERTVKVSLPLLGEGSDERFDWFGGDDDDKHVRTPFGAQPTGIAIVGSVAYVTLYTANAIAVVDLSGGADHPILGLIPTASTPSTIAFDDAHHQLVVSNDKGLGTWGSTASAYNVTGFNSHQDTGTVSLIPLPDFRTLAGMTAQVYENNHWDLTANIAASRGGNPHEESVAVPRHIGDPSLIKHVFVIVRENRTYDQVLGDVPAGNGDPALTIFGAAVTPNMHNLVTRFPLLDNYYDPSRQSADGHNWLVQGMAPYMDEIQSPDWVRSYPANGEDALAYQPKGFVWDAAEKKGLPVKIYGEYVEYAGVTFTNPDGTRNEPTWTQFYNDAVAYETGAEPQLKYATTVNVISEIPSVQKYADPHFPPFDLGIPDQFRVDLWQQDFNKDVKAGTVPALTTLWIMCDHTGGPPTAAAEQADNDLAVGRIVDAISHSPVWKDSAIFITEDDAQAGVDHVDGHRSPGYVVSPYVVQNQGANHTAFTQVNMTRTIEQILGLPPMNLFDLVASPMYNLFTNTPPEQNFAPWTHVPTQIPLYTGVSGFTTAKNVKLKPIEKAWAQAKVKIFKGKQHMPDSEDPDVVNHWVWYQTTGFNRPYPGETKVRWPSDFADRIGRANVDLDD